MRHKLSFALSFLLIVCSVSEQGYGFFVDYFCSGIYVGIIYIPSTYNRDNWIQCSKCKQTVECFHKESAIKIQL